MRNLRDLDPSRVIENAVDQPPVERASKRVMPGTTVCHIVLNEVMTGVIPSQVISPARAFALAAPDVSVRVIFLEAARVAIAGATRRRIQALRQLWPEGDIRLHAYVGRLGEFAPAMSLRRAVKNLCSDTRNLVLHCRGPEATMQAARVVDALGAGRIVFDMRGACGHEALLRAIGRGCSEEEGSAQLERGKALDDSAVRRADAVIAVGERLLEEVVFTNGPLGKFADVVPCCVDVDRFAPAPSERSRDAELRLVHVSSEPKWEAFGDVIEFLRSVLTIRKARLRFLTTLDADFVLASVAADDPIRDSIDVQASAPDEVPAVLASSDAGVLLRKPDAVHRYASPIKFGEYLSAGLPVVVSPGIGETESLVASHRVGVVVDAESYGRDAFLSAARDLVEMLENDGDGVRERARRVALERYAWPVYAGVLAHAYGIEVGVS